MKILLIPILLFSFLEIQVRAQIITGEEITIKNNEILPAMYLITNFGNINLQGPFYNLTIIPSDKRNENKINGSLFGVMTMAPLLLLYPFTTISDSTKNIADYLNYGFIGLSALLNCQVHFDLLYFNTELFNKNPKLSMFISSRTDFFTFQDNKWGQYSYGLGIEYFLFESLGNSKSYKKGFGLQFGVERPIEI
ncbi:MAG: hypothetical protein KDC67_06910, partial [Ignavibacteriae bacterium]|nr:hypothetical protein [Ignavibacteriota bacterium]